MRKGKLLAGLLAALLLAAVVPVGGFAASDISLPTNLDWAFTYSVNNLGIPSFLWRLSTALTVSGRAPQNQLQALNGDGTSGTPICFGSGTYSGSTISWVITEEAIADSNILFQNFLDNTGFYNNGECKELLGLLNSQYVTNVDFYLTNSQTSKQISATGIPELNPTSTIYSHQYSQISRFIALVASCNVTVNIKLVDLDNSSTPIAGPTLALSSQNGAGQLNKANITIGKGTTLYVNCAAYIGSCTVNNGGMLDLSALNANDLTELFTKGFGKLSILPGANLNFPKGTTWLDVTKWLELKNLYATNFNIFVDGQAISAKPDNIVISPSYGIFQVSADKYYVFKGTAAYLKVTLKNLDDWSSFKGLYPYMTGQTSSKTQFVYKTLTWRELTSSSSGPDNSVDWFAKLPAWASKVVTAAGTVYEYYIPILIGEDETSQDIKIWFSSVENDPFWLNEVDGIFHLAAKDMPKVTKLAIKPEIETVAKGAAVQFTSEVYIDNDLPEYYNLLRRDTTWSVSNQKSATTTIDKNGLLKVSVDESAPFIVVTAKTNIVDGYMFGPDAGMFYNPDLGSYYVPTSFTVTASAVIYVGTASPTPDASPLSRPIIAASHASPSSVSVSWGAVSGATGYNVYYATSASGAYTLAGTTTDRSYTVNGLSTGSYYWFKAEAKSAAATSDASDPLQVRARPLRPASINAAAGSKAGSIKVSWSQVAQCDGYAVYISTARAGTYSLKAIVSGSAATSATIAGLKAGSTYYFKAASFVQVGAAKVPSVYTGTVSAVATR